MSPQQSSAFPMSFSMLPLVPINTQQMLNHLLIESGFHAQLLHVPTDAFIGLQRLNEAQVAHITFGDEFLYLGSV